MTGSVLVLVVGGGIAGRAAARALARHGLGCTVVEPRESVGRGMGVNLPGNAVRALGEVGVAAGALAGGVPVRRREYRNGRGRLLFAMDDERFWGGVGDRSVCATVLSTLPRHFDFVIGAGGVSSTMRGAVAVDGVHPSSMTGSSWRFVGDNPGVDCWTVWSGRDETFLQCEGGGRGRGDSGRPEDHLPACGIR